MDNKKLGFLIIFLGIAFGVVLFIFKIQLNQLTNTLMTLSGGSCFLQNGSCIYEQSNLPLIFGAVLTVFTLSLGFYLIYFFKAVSSYENAHKDILNEIKSTRTIESVKERFNILLTGLDEYEKKVLTTVKEQDGILQSTLKYRTDLSKSKLSMVLAQLEKKGLISKVKKGKTNLIFLKKAF